MLISCGTRAPTLALWREMTVLEQQTSKRRKPVGKTSLHSTVLAPCECGPPDGVGGQGGGGPRGALRGVLRGGQHAGQRVGQGDQAQPTVDTKQDIAYVFANRTT